MRWYLLICGAIFAVGNVYRVIRVLRMPAHLRWELYPMPRGTSDQRRYGGSYFEQSEWWLKKSKHSRTAELAYIAGEALAFRTVWQRRRALWLWSWLMHLGFYALLAATALTGVAAITDADWVEVIRWTVIAGAAAGMAGALGLFVARIGRSTVSGMRDYFNLSIILCLCATALEAATFATAPREMISFVHSLVIADPAPGLHPALALHLAVLGIFLAYFPTTHMTHAFMKFFSFHRVRWDDAPLIHDAGLAAAVTHNLDRMLSWSAPHIRGGESWAHAVRREGHR